MKGGFLYPYGRFLSRLLGRLLLRAKATGTDHFPAQGGFILAMNHISLIDPPLIGCWVPRELFFFAKRELFANPLLGWALRNANTVPVRRGAVDRASLDKVAEVLENGFGLMIFPEGTRSRTDDFLPPKPGVGMIAMRAGCPIIVGYVQGSNRVRDCLRRRDRLRVAFGEAFSPQWVRSYPDNREGYAAIAQAVMDRMRQLKKQVAAS